MTGGVIVLVCSAIFLRNGVLGYAKGGPASVCSDPYPHHGSHAAQHSQSPFEVVADPTRYSRGSNVTVTIQLRPGGNVASSFKGFQISAHPVRGKWNDLQGEFITLPPNATPAYYFSSQLNCLTQSNNSPKKFVSMVWRAPFTSVGDIIFSATILSSYEIFWVNVTAGLAADEPYEASALLTELTISSKPRSTPLIDGCGSSKTCILWPRTCTDPEKCDAVVAYDPVGQQDVRFQMFGITPGYLSLGLSLDKMMDNDETLTCIAHPSGRLLFQRGYNPAYHNQKTTEDLVTNVSMQYENSKLYCEFIRPKFAYVNMTISRKTTLYPFDLSNPGKYYVYLGWGRLYPGSYDSIMIHDQLPVVASEKMNLSNSRIHYFNSLPVEVQVHITTMLIAWLGLSSIAVVVARYFRSNVLNTIKLGGKMAWLQIHRGMTVAAVSLTVAGFVLIFVYVDGWSARSVLHAAFGVAVMALTVLQFITALCRPRPTSNKKKAFRWFHRSVGVISWLCAAACMVLGVNISYMPPQMALWGTVCMSIWIAGQFIVMAVFELLLCNPKPASVETAVGDTTIEEKTNSERHETTRKAKSAIFIIYSVAMTLLVVACLGFTWAY